VGPRARRRTAPAALVTLATTAALVSKKLAVPGMELMVQGDPVVVAPP
jgi:hypothetical protein